MKKLFALLTVCLLCFGLTGCKGTDDASLVSGSGENFDDNMVIEFRIVNHNNRHFTPLEVVNEIAKSPLITFEYETKEVTEGQLYGFKEEVDGFKDAAMLASKEADKPVLLYVFDLGKLAYSKSFTDQLIKKIDPKFNGEREIEVVSSYAVENRIFIVMSLNTVE